MHRKAVRAAVFESFSWLTFLATRCLYINKYSVNIILKSKSEKYLSLTFPFEELIHIDWISDTSYKHVQTRPTFSWLFVLVLQVIFTTKKSAVAEYALQLITYLNHARKKSFFSWMFFVLETWSMNKRMPRQTLFPLLPNTKTFLNPCTERCPVS